MEHNCVISKGKKKNSSNSSIIRRGVLLLPNGRTAHSRFRIPIDIDELSICDIKHGTKIAELLTQTDLIIWDEA